MQSVSQQLPMPWASWKFLPISTKCQNFSLPLTCHTSAQLGPCHCICTAVSQYSSHSCFPVQQPNLQHFSPICSLCHHGITETWASRKSKEKPKFSHTNHCSSRAKQQRPESETPGWQTAELPTCQKYFPSICSSVTCFGCSYWRQEWQMIVHGKTISL